MSQLKSLNDCRQDLVDVAMGREFADTVIRNGTWVNVYSGELIQNTDISIKAGRFAFIGPDSKHTIGKNTKVIEANGKYLVPGFCDAHMHIESGMVTITEFSRAVIPHGTTTMFVDPHEIANVLGLPGIKLMHDETLNLPINVYVQVPSCVPSAPGLETSGASLDVNEISEALNWPNVCGLGEVMNFPGVANNDRKMVDEISATWAVNKTIGGHYASTDLGLNFHGYVAGGPQDDHEGTRKEDAVARVRQGMKAMLRLGSAWYDVASQVKAITEDGLDSRNFILCTDDSHSGTLIEEGHMNRVIKHAISQGLKPITAIQMGTINTAQHFKMEYELGSISPGRRADMIVTSSLSDLPIETVLARGQVVAENGVLKDKLPKFTYPKFARSTINIKKRIDLHDFDIKIKNSNKKSVKVRTIGVVENQAPTKLLISKLKVEGKIVEMDRAKDICQISLIERHHSTGKIVNGFVSGFGYKVDCAVASTIAHDSHHMIVVGTEKKDMALAANKLNEIGGGLVVFSKGKLLALLELPIAGLMSDKVAEVVAKKANLIVSAMETCGCQLNNAIMQHSLLALAVIPEIRISDLGIIDVTKFKHVDLFV